MSSKDAKEVCTLCGMNRLPKCKDGSIEFGPCAFGTCDNLRTLEQELWELMKDRPFEWRRVRGHAYSWTHRKYSIHAVGTGDNNQVIVRLPNGRLMSKPKDTFSDIGAVDR